jgi:hypothetical protein
MDDTKYKLPYSNDSTTSGTSLYALCNVSSGGTFIYDGYSGKIKGIHFGSD